jgi:hypothetical protein
MHDKLFILLFSLILACSFYNKPFAEDIKSTSAAVPGRAALQSLHSEDIRKIMRRLNALAYEREYTELELDQIRDKNLRALAHAAEDLMEISEQLPEILPDNQLSYEEQVTFKAMARQLHNETLNLLNTGSTKNYSEIKSGYLRLQQTCAACHNLFRDW